MATATTKVLYNNAFGDGFELSRPFLEEFTKRRGKEIDINKALFWKGTGSIRCDPLAIALFQEKGSEWSSGPSASIQLREFSAVFDKYWEVEEQDGDEYVRVLVADALADILHTFIETGDREALDRQYKAIMDGANTLNESMYSLPTAGAEGELKKAPESVVSHVGHTYFGTEGESESKTDLGHA